MSLKNMFEFLHPRWAYRVILRLITVHLFLNLCKCYLKAFIKLHGIIIQVKCTLTVLCIIKHNCRFLGDYRNLLESFTVQMLTIASPKTR